MPVPPEGAKKIPVGTSGQRDRARSVGVHDGAHGSVLQKAQLVARALTKSVLALAVLGFLELYPRE